MKVILIVLSQNHLLLSQILSDSGLDVYHIVSKTNHLFYRIKNDVEKLNNVFLTEGVDDLYQTIERVIIEKKIEYIIPIYLDGMNEKISQINTKFNLHGLQKKTGEFLKNKSSYYNVLSNLQIPVPKIYKKVPSLKTLENVDIDFKFPVIAKPSIGTQSVGIQILETKEKLIDFFSDTENKVSNFQESHENKYKQLQYYSGGHEYIIQEYIKGSVVSVVGHVYNKEVCLDYLYDIEADCYPYFAETSLSIPSKHDSTEFKKLIKSDMEKFFNFIELDNCPFMIDIIKTNNSYYYIDFASRFSVGTSHLIYYSGGRYYVKNVVEKILKGKKFDLNLQPSMCKFFPFKSGRIKKFKINKPDIAEFIQYPSSDVLQNIRNDLSIQNNGFIVVTGKTKEETEIKYNELISSCDIQYF